MSIKSKVVPFLEKLYTNILLIIISVTSMSPKGYNMFMRLKGMKKARVRLTSFSPTTGPVVKIARMGATTEQKRTK